MGGVPRRWRGGSSLRDKSRIPTIKSPGSELTIEDPKAGTIMGDGMAVYMASPGTIRPAFGSWPGSMPVVGFVHAPGTTIHTGTPVNMAVGGYKTAPQYGFTTGKTVYVSKIRPGSLTTNLGSVSIVQRVGVAAKGSALLIHIQAGTPSTHTGTISSSSIGSLSITGKTYGTLGPTRIATGTYARLAAGSLLARRSYMQAGSVIGHAFGSPGAPTLTEDSTVQMSFRGVNWNWQGNAVIGNQTLDWIAQTGDPSLAVRRLWYRSDRGLFRYALDSTSQVRDLIGVGSTVAVPGSVPGVRVAGTITHSVYSQNLGSHLAGSVQTAPTVRYAVWPTAFPNNSYVANIYVQFRASGTAQGPDDYRYGILSKKAGSVRYFVKTQAGIAGVGTIPPVGTVTLVGFAN